MSEFKHLEEIIRDVPDFPKKGVIFKDITPLLNEKFTETIDAMISLVPNWDEVDAICGIESRGFIFGSAIAQEMGLGFIPLRKKGKLPPPTFEESYSLEYGEATLEIQDSYQSGSVILIDDVIATGGTLKAGHRLCETAGLKVSSALALINLKFLNNLKDFSCEIHSVFEY